MTNLMPDIGPSRFKCTAEDPWTPEKGKWAYHPDARCLSQDDGYPGGDIAHYRCPHCNKEFSVELAQ